MGNKGIGGFRQAVAGDLALQGRIRGGEDLIAIASSLGFAITSADLTAAADSDELTQFELDLIAGGATQKDTGEC